MVPTVRSSLDFSGRAGLGVWLEQTDSEAVCEGVGLLKSTRRIFKDPSRGTVDVSKALGLRMEDLGSERA